MSDRQKVGALVRRRNRLKERLEQPWKGSPNGEHRTKAELSALIWAIEICELWCEGNERAQAQKEKEQ